MPELPDVEIFHECVPNGMGTLDALTWIVAIGIALTAIIVNELHKHFRTPAQ